MHAAELMLANIMCGAIGSRELDHVITSFTQVMLPALESNDVTVQIKACGLSRIDTKVGCRITLWSNFHKFLFPDYVTGGTKYRPNPSRQRDFWNHHKRLVNHA